MDKDKYIIIGKSIYGECADCRSLVKINKFIFGSMHICDAPTNENKKK